MNIFFIIKSVTFNIKETLLVLLFFINGILFCQNKSSVELVLLSLTDSLPIVNAHLLIKQEENEIVYVSNQDGVFNVNKDLIGKNVNIEFSALGYEKIIKECLTQKVYYTNKIIEELQEVIIVSKQDNNRDKLTPSLFKKLNKFKRNFGWKDKVAVYIPQNKKNQDKPILKIKYKTTNFKGVKGIEYLPFIANIYSVDKNTGLPSKALLGDTIVSKEQGKKWAVVDVSNENVLIPKEGLYIVYELLDFDYYEVKWLQSQIGAISAVPALEVFKFDEDYISKSYQFFSATQQFSPGYLANNRLVAFGWSMVNWHYIIEIEQ
ncbi:hypothetical protein GCM10022271_09330 [Corallibacter vietnamensis]|uniref:Carboxypeptidase-like regulatory domain-containing protein n=1 Tax=Corallibacter vietnamensis TaxID=904130 RepID=A0ABP7GYI6_9FLAO